VRLIPAVTEEGTTQPQDLVRTAQPARARGGPPVSDTTVSDFRRHRPWCPHGRPAGTRRLDLATDYDAFPVWTWFTLPAIPGRRPAREVHGCASPQFLGISADLAGELQAWADWHDRRQQSADRSPAFPAEPATVDERRQWRAHGVVLARRLAEETGAEVVYHETFDGWDPDCPHCGPSAIAERVSSVSGPHTPLTRG
jgi:hypothetical protein